jgi:hypothetical protein
MGAYHGLIRLVGVGFPGGPTAAIDPNSGVPIAPSDMWTDGRPAGA